MGAWHAATVIVLWPQLSLAKRVGNARAAVVIYVRQSKLRMNNKRLQRKKAKQLGKLIKESNEKRLKQLQQTEPQRINANFISAKAETF